MFSHQHLNPAYAGSKDYSNFTILHRMQWLNFDGAPESQSFTFSNKMSPKKLGVGISGVNDKIGPLNNTSVAADVSYHLPTGGSSFLSLGLKLGVANINFDTSILSTSTPNDVAFSFEENDSFIPNLGFGFYYHSPKFYAGFSVPWIIEKNSFNLKRHLYLISGGLVSFTENIQLKPSILLKHTPGAITGYDLSALFQYKELFWIGPQMRSSIFKILPQSEFGGGFGLMGGIYLSKNISVGYTYNTSSLDDSIKFSNPTHEFMLRFDLIRKDFSVLRSPRIF